MENKLINDPIIKEILIISFDINSVIIKTTVAKQLFLGNRCYKFYCLPNFSSDRLLSNSFLATVVKKFV